MIITQNAEFIVYERDGQNYFISESCKAGAGNIEGTLIKKSTSKMAATFNTNLYHERRVMIDFRLERIYFQKHIDERISINDTKHIDFKDVERVEKCGLDVWSHDTTAKYKNKFMLFCSGRVYELFCFSKTERELWVEHLCKVLDVNAGIPVDFNNPSERYNQLQESVKAGRNSSRLDYKRAPMIIDKEGFTEYRTQTLLYT